MHADGWINADSVVTRGIDLVGDIRGSLPFATGSLDYIVAMHVLQDLPYLDIVPALSELRRVLRAGGALRAGVPDLERAIAAFLRDDPAYFYVPDDEAATTGAKLVAQLTWYGSVRTPFTWDFAREMCARAGFRATRRVRFGETTTAHEEIVDLDNRERETLFFEALA